MPFPSFQEALMLPPQELHEQLVTSLTEGQQVLATTVQGYRYRGEVARAQDSTLILVATTPYQEAGPQPEAGILAFYGHAPRWLLASCELLS